MTLALGIYPAAVTDIIGPSVKALVEHVGTAVQAAAAATN
jgi:NADH-quinone oxidoreductase subunit M